MTMGMVPLAIQEPTRMPTESMIRMAGMALWMLSTMPRSMSFHLKPRSEAQHAGDRGRGDEEDLGLDLVDAVADAEEQGHGDERNEGDAEVRRRPEADGSGIGSGDRPFDPVLSGAERAAGQEPPAGHHPPSPGEDVAQAESRRRATTRSASRPGAIRPFLPSL